MQLPGSYQGRVNIDGDVPGFHPDERGSSPRRATNFRKERDEDEVVESPGLDPGVSTCEACHRDHLPAPLL